MWDLFNQGSKLLLSAVVLFPISVSAHYADTVNFRFATEAEARMLVGADDDFTAGWSEFDIISRLQNESGTKADLVAFKQRVSCPDFG